MNPAGKWVIVLTTVGLLSACNENRTQQKMPIENTIQRIIGDKVAGFRFDTITAENGMDVFEIESAGDKIVLRGSSQNAIGYAFHWYLKYFCHAQYSNVGENLNLPDPLPKPGKKIRQVSRFKYRYFMNYCTFNYSASFWDWDRWQKELDWMAINGINMPLAIIGTEAVWQNTLQKFNFTNDEIKAFIPGPAYTAWWLMGNLEKWGGPVSQEWIDSRVVLQQKIVQRMRELGMTPVFHGFYGMVPDKMRQKFPNNKIYYGGIWASDHGFQRPAYLDPTDSLFARMAEVYYDEQTRLYGATAFYGGDPFHEGGNMEGVNITESARRIEKAMQAAHPGSTWVLQGWWDNPRQELLDGIDKDKVLILDLFAESQPQWKKRKGYDGRKWIWNALLNFGGKEGDFGKLDTFATEPVRALESQFGKSLCGIGTMPEGCLSNPVNFELIYEMPWISGSPNMHQWINEFAYARYGKKINEAEQAWYYFYKTAYNCPTDQAGPTESIFCARGSLNVTGAFNWGTVHVYYDTNEFGKGVEALLKCAPELSGIDAYQYDVVDFTRQYIANRALEVYRDMISAYKQKNKQLMNQKANAFLKLIDLQDSLLSMRKEFLLGNWIESAKNAAYANDTNLFEFNARAQITVWGDEGTAMELHDYANKEWAGMLSDFYKPRWELFINSLNESIEIGNPKPVNYYAFDKTWIEESKIYPTKSDAFDIKVIQSIFEQTTE